ncbi:hypothetical protein LCGC14_1851640 [marine sediment metagenome]|uniref:NAD-dependent epimerase/dehydratase domain-containing protein n=1 Tax=marine sediment metagenome TaxID=412755 RepID=A0A0F9GAG9_9ZZZZ
MQITLTGGSGFIGTRLTARLIESGHNVSNIDIKMSRSFPDFWVEVDVRDAQALQNSLTGDAIVHLAAVHRDDVYPLSLYAENNIEGARNLCRSAEANGINKIVFTSSVAVYGFAAPDTDELGEINPFNEYGRTKFEAELLLRDWQERDPEARSLTIIRPTVVFGEGNRGNVYNLLNQIHKRKFIMVGKGENRKSMAYVENLAAFLAHSLQNPAGVHVFNYVDKPDFTMNELVSQVRSVLTGKASVGIRLPLIVGQALGNAADAVSPLLGRNLPISSIRVKKFVSNSSFSSGAHGFRGFAAPIGLSEGLRRTLNSEFINPDPQAESFVTE